MQSSMMTNMTTHPLHLKSGLTARLKRFLKNKDDDDGDDDDDDDYDDANAAGFATHVNSQSALGLCANFASPLEGSQLARFYRRAYELRIESRGCKAAAGCREHVPHGIRLRLQIGDPQNDGFCFTTQT